MSNTPYFDLAAYNARKRVAALLNRRIRKAGLDISFDRVSPCANGVLIFTRMEPGAPSGQAIAAAANYPGVDINEKLGIVSWPC